MLVVEGSDGVGKTVFCHALLKELESRGPWIYSHFGLLPITWRYPSSYFPHMSKYLVQDRFHMSEIVYRKARGEPQELSSFAYSIVDAKLCLLGGLTVILVADEQVIHYTFNPEETYLH